MRLIREEIDKLKLEGAKSNSLDGKYNYLYEEYTKYRAETDEKNMELSKRILQVEWKMDKVDNILHRLDAIEAQIGVINYDLS